MLLDPSVSAKVASYFKGLDLLGYTTIGDNHWKPVGATIVGGFVRHNHGKPLDTVRNLWLSWCHHGLRCEIHASISVAEFCKEESNATSDCHCSALAQLLAMDVNVTKSGWKAFVSITASARNHWSWRMGCDAPMLLHSHRWISWDLVLGHNWGITLVPPNKKLPSNSCYSWRLIPIHMVVVTPFPPGLQALQRGQSGVVTEGIRGPYGIQKRQGGMPVGGRSQGVQHGVTCRFLRKWRGSHWSHHQKANLFLENDGKWWEKHWLELPYVQANKLMCIRCGNAC